MMFILLITICLLLEDFEPQEMNERFLPMMLDPGRRQTFTAAEERSLLLNAQLFFRTTQSAI